MVIRLKMNLNVGESVHSCQTLLQKVITKNTVRKQISLFGNENKIRLYELIESNININNFADDKLKKLD
jgi:hypothetical protein